MLMAIKQSAQNRKAVLLLIKPENENYLRQKFLNDEMRMLAISAGYNIEDEIVLPKKNPIYFFSHEKLELLAEELKNKSDNNEKFVFIVGSHLTPKQHINMEEIFGNHRIIDKFELVLEIFAERATTIEAKLQIELASLQYERAREKLRLLHQLGIEGAWHQEREGGFHGKGETPLNVFNAKMTKLESQLKAKLNEIKKRRNYYRYRRKKKDSSRISMAIIGYTSAGKSTLLNKLTNTESASVSPRLFETLDTRIRAFNIDDLTIFVSDTVGFIEDLPTFLIDSFKSTLEESIHSDILLIIIDASNPMEMIINKAKTTFEIIHEIQAANKKLVVLNKTDLISDEHLKRVIDFFSTNEPFNSYPCVDISAKNDITKLIETLDTLQLIPPLAKFRCRFTQNYKLRSIIYDEVKVVSENLENDHWEIEFVTRRHSIAKTLLLKKANKLKINDFFIDEIDNYSSCFVDTSG